MSAFRPLLVAALATLSAGQASVDCSTGVTSVVGGGVGWDAAVTLADGVRSNTGRDYQFQGVPSFMNGGRYFASGVWPEGNGYSLTINYDAPAMVFIYVSDDVHDAGMSARLVDDGWDEEAIDTFQRIDPTGALPAKTLHVYSRFFATGNVVTVGPLNGTLVSGIISTCDWPTTTTTITSTGTTKTTTSTVTTTLTSTTRTSTGTTTTLTTVTSTSTTFTTSKTSTSTVTTSSSTTRTSTGTTTTLTTTTSTTTAMHRVALIEGQMFMLVDRPSELENQINGDDTVRQAVVVGIANSVPGVEPHLTRILTADLGNQMPSVGQEGSNNRNSGNTGNGGNSGNGGNRRLRGAEPRQLAGVVVVDYQALVPMETVARHGLNAQYFVTNSTRDNLNVHVVEQVQAVTDFVVSRVEVTEPEFTITLSHELGWHETPDEEPPAAMNRNNSSAAASGGWIAILAASVVGVCCVSYVFTVCLRRVLLHEPGKETEQVYDDDKRASDDGSMEVGPEMSDDCKAATPRRMVSFQGLDQESDNLATCGGPSGEQQASPSEDDLVIYV